jgi:hypothetical protein
MIPILQSALPSAPWMDPRTSRLPGVLPLEGDDWLRVDEAYGAQMAERDRLLAEMPDQVHALLPQAFPAAAELYGRVLARLADAPGYRVQPDKVLRPDGVSVPLDPTQPLLTLGRLVQEDLCLLEAAGTEHVLTGANLCFPASWTLAQKIGRPLSAIHLPVPSYDEGITRRVQLRREHPGLDRKLTGHLGARLRGARRLLRCVQPRLQIARHRLRVVQRALLRRERRRLLDALRDGEQRGHLLPRLRGRVGRRPVERVADAQRQVRHSRLTARSSVGRARVVRSAPSLAEKKNFFS